MMGQKLELRQTKVAGFNFENKTNFLLKLMIGFLFRSFLFFKLKDLFFIK